MIKWFKKWFKDFFRRPVKIIFTLLAIMLILVNLQHINDTFAIITEYGFWITFGAIGIIGIYNFIKNSSGWYLTPEEKKEWDEFYEKNPDKKPKKF